jgi:hypothetical protein
MSQGLYLYGIAMRDRLPSLSLDRQGLDGKSPLQVVDFQNLAAVLSPVSLEDFCGPEADERMQDVTWIGPRVIRHQEVVAAVMQHSPVLPARFGTIFSSRESLIEVLRRHHDAISGFLERITGQEEWAVKGMLDQASSKEKLFSLKLEEEADRLGALSPGQRYFHEQRLRAGCDQDLQHLLKDVSRELWAGLKEYVADVRERRVLSRKASGSDRDMVWNWAFLVPVAAMPAFLAQVREVGAQCAHSGLVIECSGPWPPYSFTPALDLGAGT